MRLVERPDALAEAVAAARREAARRVRLRRGVPRAVPALAPPRGGADRRRTRPGRCCISSTGSARCSGATKRWSRRRRPSWWAAAPRARMWHGRRGGGPRRWATRAWARWSSWSTGERLLLLGDEHPPAGRARGHRAGDRARPGGVAAGGGRPGGPSRSPRSDVTVSGHAIEARLCAERPARGLPAHARARRRHVRWPARAGVRTDAGIESGSTVSSSYDSLVAKVMAHGETGRPRSARPGPGAGRARDGRPRDQPRTCSAPILGDAVFGAGEAGIDYLDRRADLRDAGLDADGSASVTPPPPRSPSSTARAAGSAGARRPPPDGATSARPSTPDASPTRRATLESSGRAGPIGADGGPGRRPVASRWARAARRRGGRSSTSRSTACGGATGCAWSARWPTVNGPEGQSSFIVGAEDDVRRPDGTAGECRAPLPGAVARVLVAAGDAVNDGDGLVVLEAMKMEHTLAGRRRRHGGARFWCARATRWTWATCWSSSRGRRVRDRTGTAGGQLQRVLRRPPFGRQRDGRGRPHRRAHRRLAGRADHVHPAQDPGAQRRVRPHLPAPARRGAAHLHGAGHHHRLQCRWSQPRGLAEAVRELARRQGVAVRVASVSGDDIAARAARAGEAGQRFVNLDTGEPLAARRALVTANAYLGGRPIADALGGRAAGGGHRPGHRRLAHRGPGPPRLRWGRQRLRRHRRRGGGRPRHRVRGAVLRRQLRLLRRDPRHRRASGFPSPSFTPTARRSSPSIPAPGAR